jgi:cobyrinic acid a,c-diamide synthase
LALLIAAPCSGSGKTLVSLLLAAVAQHRALPLQTFKVGPDYLDPQLLASASGRPCRNLDLLLCGAPWVRRSFEWWSRDVALTLVEGVMGLYDGRGPSSEGSSAAVALELGLPVLLVVEASRQAGSLAALVRGFRDHEPRLQLAGVVLNGVSTPRHRQLLAEALSAIGVPLLGVLPRHEALALPSRHLGLLPPQELPDWPQRLKQFAALAQQWLELERLLPLMAPPVLAPGALSPIAQALGGHPAAAPQAQGPSHGPNQGPLITIARDQAFHFCYPELPEWLGALGCRLAWWAPLGDEALPAGTAALVLPGGYPELHGAQLSQCQRSLGALAEHCRQGRPLYAECGGLLLLGQELCDAEGQGHPMAGVLPFRAQRGALSLGYREARPLGGGLVLRPGETLRGHEFHRWQLEQSGEAWRLEGWGVEPRLEGWSTPTLHASWLHLHWGGCPLVPQRLRDAAILASTAP